MPEWRVKDPEFLNPCSDCQSEILTVRKPDQAIAILYNDVPRHDDLYIRYLKQPDGSWKLSGIQLVYIEETTNARPHKVVRLWAKPFSRSLAINRKMDSPRFKKDRIGST